MPESSGSFKPSSDCFDVAAGSATGAAGAGRTQSRCSADTSLPKATSYAATSLFGAPPSAARTSPTVAVASEPTAESSAVTMDSGADAPLLLRPAADTSPPTATPYEAVSVFGAPPLAARTSPAVGVASDLSAEPSAVTTEPGADEVCAVRPLRPVVENSPATATSSAAASPSSVPPPAARMSPSVGIASGLTAESSAVAMDVGADAPLLLRPEADTSPPTATPYEAAAVFGAPPLAARTSPAVGVASEPSAEPSAVTTEPGADEVCAVRPLRPVVETSPATATSSAGASSSRVPLPAAYTSPAVGVASGPTAESSAVAMDLGADAPLLLRPAVDTSPPSATPYEAELVFGAPPLAARTSPSVGVASEPSAEPSAVTTDLGADEVCAVRLLRPVAETSPATATSSKAALPSRVPPTAARMSPAVGVASGPTAESSAVAMDLGADVTCAARSSRHAADTSPPMATAYTAASVVGALPLASRTSPPSEPVTYHAAAITSEPSDDSISSFMKKMLNVPVVRKSPAVSEQQVDLDDAYRAMIAARKKFELQEKKYKEMLTISGKQELPATSADSTVPYEELVLESSPDDPEHNHEKSNDQPEDTLDQEYVPSKHEETISGCCVTLSSPSLPEGCEDTDVLLNKEGRKFHTRGNQKLTELIYEHKSIREAAEVKNEVAKTVYDAMLATGARFFAFLNKQWVEMTSPEKIIDRIGQRLKNNKCEGTPMDLPVFTMVSCLFH